MLNTIVKWISASFKGLFFCGCCNPEAGDPTPDPTTASRSSQDTHLINPPDLALEISKTPTSEKSSHSVSNGSAGDQSGMAVASQDTAAQDTLPNRTDQLPVHQDNMLQPDTPPSEMDMQNHFTHQGALVQHPQLVGGLREVDSISSTVPPSVAEGSDKTVDNQNLSVPQEVAAQSNVIALEMDDQKLAVRRETAKSQLDTWPRQGDLGYGSSQGQVTDASLPLSMVNDQNHSVLPASEPQGVMAQPSSFVSEKLPRKKGDDRPPQIFKERLPRKTTVMVGEIAEDAQPSRVTSDRVPEVEDDLPPLIMKERPPRKRIVVEEEIVENAQLSHIRT